MVIVPNKYDVDEILYEKKQKKHIVTKDEFVQLVQKHIFPLLAPYEEERKHIKNLSNILHILSFIFFVPMTIFAYKVIQTGAKFEGILFIFCFIPSFIAWYKGHTFIKQRKEDFLHNLLGYLGSFSNGQTRIGAGFLNDSYLFPNLVFTDRNNFERGGLFKNTCPVEIEEAFEGHYLSTKFSVAETILEYTKGYGKKKRRVFVFKGMIIAIPLQKEILGHTVIYNTKFTFKQALTDLEKVELEDEEFMRNYTIYSSSQIEARSILMPIFIERLKNLKKAFQSDKTDMSVFDGHMLFMISTKKNLFEPFSLRKSLYNMKNFLKFYEEIRAVCAIIETLNIDNEKERISIF